MVEGNIKIHPTTRIGYFPRLIVNDGYKGEVRFMVNASTLILIKPGATYENVEESLRILLKDIQLRKKLLGESV